MVTTDQMTSIDFLVILITLFDIGFPRELLDGKENLVKVNNRLGYN